MEIKALRLAIFVVRYHQISNGLRFWSYTVAVAELFALGFALQFLCPLFLAGTLFLTLGKCCARARSHSF